MKKFWISFVSILLVVLLPIAGFFIYGECIQSHEVYSETYYAELKDKVERLKTRENKKIVFIGGSSLIFGLRSEEIEKATGYDVVDFGLYASLGTPIMMNLAKDYIKEGDIVVLAPEINDQTYSTYLGYDVALKCFENMDYPINKFNINQNMDFFFRYFKYVVEKGNANIELVAPYDKASFNEYTDIDNEIVKNNIMESQFDPTQLIAPNVSLLNPDFMNIVNSYNDLMLKKNAKLYFSFSPTNALSLNEEGLNEFNKGLEEKLNCPILGNVKDYTYHQYYFYDTNFHLNKVGSYLHSRTLVEKLKKAESITNEYEIKVPDVPVPKYKKGETGIVIDNMVFDEIYEFNQLSFSFVGVSDNVKSNTSFTIPNEIYAPQYEKVIKVTAVGDKPFKNMDHLTSITINDGIANLLHPIADNCPNVNRVELLAIYPPNICASGFLEGTNPLCKIYVPKESYSTYKTSYAWISYKNVINSLP